MVFFTQSSGSHLVEVNGKPIKNESYNIVMNKDNNNGKNNGKNNEKVLINTNENNKNYSRNFDSLSNFFDVLQKNDGSIFNVTRNYHAKKPRKTRNQKTRKQKTRKQKTRNKKPRKQKTRK